MLSIEVSDDLPLGKYYDLTGISSLSFKRIPDAIFRLECFL